MLCIIKMKKSFFVIIYLFLNVFVFCQDPSVFEKLKKEYPDEIFVQLSKKVYYSIKIEKEKLNISMAVSEKFIYLKNASGFSIDRSVFSSEFSELKSFEANSYVLEKNKYRKIPVKNYHQKINTGQTSFYDDIKELVFTFPGVSEGTVVELNTVHTIHEPRFLSTVYLESFYPVNEYEVIFEYDEKVNLELLKINVPQDYGTYSTKQDKGSIIHKWKDTGVKVIKFEHDDADVRYFAAHFIPIIRNYKAAGKEIDILSNCESLYKWYYGFIENFDEGIDETDLKKITDSVTFGCNTELEKVEKLYFWVQDNIKYIAFEYGLGGFIPRKPDAVLNNHYGDCKDKAALLHTLLKIAGIKSYFTWIGTNDIPYTYDEVSSPVTDNHMILTYVSNGEYYFLDGTGKYISLNFPTSFIQGKQALIAIEKDSFEIKTIPLMSPDLSVRKDMCVMEIVNGKIKGNGATFFTGYRKTNVFYGISKIDEPDKKEYVEDILEKGNNKFKLLEFELNKNERVTNPLEITYNFELDNYLKVLHNELFINLNLNRRFLDYKLSDKRTKPVAFENCHTIQDEFKFVIPAGYHSDYLPPDESGSGEKLEYKITYSVKNDTVFYNQTISLKDIMIEKDHFEEWNKIISGLEKAYKQSILLKKDEE